jgi:RimJ/RimL family protein N-acetyltransferase
MIPAFELVTTERLVLRPFRESDLDVILTLHADPATNRYNPNGSMRTLDDARERLALWLSDYSQKGVGYWAVARREAPGIIVGVGGVRHKELEGQHVLNLAYRFSPEAWGSGYATEVSRVALELARKHIPDVPVAAIINEVNTPSIRVAERLGLRLDRVIDYDGVPSRVYLDR